MPAMNADSVTEFVRKSMIGGACVATVALVGAVIYGIMSEFLKNVVWSEFAVGIIIAIAAVMVLYVVGHLVLKFME